MNLNRFDKGFCIFFYIRLDSFGMKSIEFDNGLFFKSLFNSICDF